MNEQPTYQELERKIEELKKENDELKRIEEELRQSEESYRNIMALAPDIISISTLEEGRYLQVNDAFCRRSGYSYDQVIGHTTAELKIYAHPELRKQMVETVTRDGYLEGMELQFRAKDGSSRYSLMSVRPIQYQGEDCIISINTDITPIREANNALKESEEKYRMLVDNSYEGILIIQDDIMKFPNPRIMELTGYSYNELTSMSFDQLIQTQDLGFVRAYYQEILKEPKKKQTCSFRMLNKKQEILWVELNAVAIDWETRPATINFLRDMTAQRKMEAQLMQAHKMEAIGTLAGGIAHDFNNLLMGIQGNASLMLIDTPSGHPFRERLVSIEELVKKGAELTKQLLGMARGGKYEVKATNVNTLVATTANIFGRTKKEIEIEVELQENIWPVEIDRSQIEQVLLNLYVNAWHAMPEGGNLYLETRNVTLDEYYVRPFEVDPGKYVRISVTDSGTGMPESVRLRVFDPFFTTKELDRGTGLGLASAYGIIRNHGGIINVYSEEGEGSTFNIYLPVTEKEISEEKTTSDNLHLGNETILLIDDESTILEIGSDLLKRLGYEVITAASGQEALRIYQEAKEKIDLVILDMIMPVMSGGETFDRLREINPRVRVLLSSGYSINGQAKTILDRGCLGFLKKPFNLTELSQRLRQVLDGAKE
jgi:two-component system, cell cycle sensor histidine kinase and response regulator CckA